MVSYRCSASRSGWQFLDVARRADQRCEARPSAGTVERFHFGCVPLLLDSLSALCANRRNVCHLFWIGTDSARALFRPFGDGIDPTRLSFPDWCREIPRSRFRYDDWHRPLAGRATAHDYDLLRAVQSEF